jgi:hypothetical protein
MKRKWCEIVVGESRSKRGDEMRWVEGGGAEGKEW